jgi:hypothetical protein
MNSRDHGVRQDHDNRTGARGANPRLHTNMPFDSAFDAPCSFSGGM